MGKVKVCKLQVIASWILNAFSFMSLQILLDSHATASKVIVVLKGKSEGYLYLDSLPGGMELAIESSYRATGVCLS